MTITRFDPFRDLAYVQDRINRIFGDVSRGGDDGVTRGDWAPPVDIFENDEHEIVLEAELPGIERDDIDIRVENNLLTIRGERKREETRQEAHHRVERAYGTFSRSFSLPSTIDANKVSADLKNGVLTIALPARDEARPRQIQVKVN